MRVILYQLAFIQGDEAEMRRQIDWATGKPSEYLMLYAQRRLQAGCAKLTNCPAAPLSWPRAAICLSMQAVKRR